MRDRDKEALGAIERTQAALRESIVEAKELAEESDRLIRKYRRKIEAE